MIKNLSGTHRSRTSRPTSNSVTLADKWSPGQLSVTCTYCAGDFRVRPQTGTPTQSIGTIRGREEKPGFTMLVDPQCDVHLEANRRDVLKEVTHLRTFISELASRYANGSNTAEAVRESLWDVCQRSQSPANFRSALQEKARELGFGESESVMPASAMGDGGDDSLYSGLYPEIELGDVPTEAATTNATEGTAAEEMTTAALWGQIYDARDYLGTVVPKMDRKKREEIPMWVSSRVRASASAASAL